MSRPTNPTAAIIRRAEFLDESPILDLWEQLVTYYQSIGALRPRRWMAPMSLERRRERLSKLWNDEEHCVGFVAEVDGEIRGFCRAELTPDGPGGASVHTLVVDSSLRGQGIGRSLMSAVFEWCVAHGVDEVTLDVLPANVNAAAFHGTLGFEPILNSYLKRLD